MENTVGTAVKNAIEFLQSRGYVGGDIHDGLVQALNRLQTYDVGSLIEANGYAADIEL